MKIEATEYSPLVSFDENTHTLFIRGRSIPENSVEFYTPVQQFVESLINSSTPLTVDVKLDYFNTSSSKQLLDLFSKMRPMANADERVKVIWRYDEDDDDLRESGEDYRELIHVPFELIPE